MKRVKLSLMLTALVATVSFAAQPALNGFKYAAELAPDGNEWQSPERLALNKEQPRAYFFPFESVEKALKVLPENSTYWQSLNGQWKFNWVKSPDLRPKNFFETSFDASAWDNINVPSN